MSKDTTTAARAGIASCPHCGNKLKIRSSRPAAGLARELALVCEGENGCSAKFAGILELTHQTAPSARPREGLTLRQAPYRHRTVNDNHLPKRDASGPEVPPPPANDTAELDAATG